MTDISLRDQAKKLVLFYRYTEQLLDTDKPVHFRTRDFLQNACSGDFSRPEQDSPASALERVLKGFKRVVSPMFTGYVEASQALKEKRVESTRLLSADTQLVTLFTESMRSSALFNESVLNERPDPEIANKIKQLAPDQARLLEQATGAYRALYNARINDLNRTWPQVDLLERDLFELPRLIFNETGIDLSTNGSQREVSSITKKSAIEMEKVLSRVPSNRWNLIVPALLVGMGAYLASHILPSPADLAFSGAEGIAA